MSFSSKQTIIKQDKLYLRTKRNKGKEWIPVNVVLFSRDDQAHMEMNEVTPLDFDHHANDNTAVDDIYDMPELITPTAGGAAIVPTFTSSPSFSPQKSTYSHSICLSNFKTANLKKMKPSSRQSFRDRGKQTTSTFNITDEIELVPVGHGSLISRSGRKFRLGFTTSREASTWYTTIMKCLDKKHPHSLNGSAMNTPSGTATPKDFADMTLIDNDIYESTTQLNHFHSTIIDTDKSLELRFHGDYYLEVGEDSVNLLDINCKAQLHQWKIRSIRKVGVHNTTIKFETGSGCDGGAGTLIFCVQRAAEFNADFKKSQQNLRKKSCQPSSAPNTTAASSDVYSLINVDKKRNDRAHRDLPRSRSPSPSPPPVPLPPVMDDPLDGPPSLSTIPNLSLDDGYDSILPYQNPRYSEYENIEQSAPAAPPPRESNESIAVAQ